MLKNIFDLAKVYKCDKAVIAVDLPSHVVESRKVKGVFRITYMTFNKVLRIALAISYDTVAL